MLASLGGGGGAGAAAPPGTAGSVLSLASRLGGA